MSQHSAQCYETVELFVVVVLEKVYSPSHELFVVGLLVLGVLEKRTHLKGEKECQNSGGCI